MGRINTNISSLRALHSMTRNNGNMATRLERLSTGLQVNRGKDNPAGLIASEVLRGEIVGINRAIENSARAIHVINTAEGALAEASALLLELQQLTNETANTGGLSPEEIQANQLQADSILGSIRRIADTTHFNGVRLLSGDLDFVTSGVSAVKIDVLRIHAAALPENGTDEFTVRVTKSAEVGVVTFNSARLGALPTELEVAGSLGTERLTFAAGSTASSIAVAINQLQASTGVSASVLGNGTLKMQSTRFGSREFVSVKTLAGSFVDGKDFGVDAEVSVNGSKARVEGLTAIVRRPDLDVTITLDPAFAQTNSGTPAGGNTTTFSVLGGGAKFQIGSEVRRAGQAHVGLASLSTEKLGDGVVGYLSSLASGGANSLAGGNTVQAQKVLDEAIRQVSTLRGRLGALQRNVLETNSNSLSVALENVTASESAIRDADFANETAELTRAQILVQANTSVMAQANSSPQSVLSLLA